MRGRVAASQVSTIVVRADVRGRVDASQVSTIVVRADVRGRVDASQVSTEVVDRPNVRGRVDASQVSTGSRRSSGQTQSRCVDMGGCITGKYYSGQTSSVEMGGCITGKKELRRRLGATPSRSGVH